MKYRADIDGLRAISVLAVVLFHGGIPPFTGGFIGVDVFFVISGFLITTIIISNIDRGVFSLARFYERRIRRLGPALLVIVSFIVLFNVTLKTPKELDTFGESVSFFGLLASNHFFAQERGYFDVARESHALLHTWSLAVEEQFYLVFPLILMGLTVWARRWRFAAVVAIAVISFVVSAVLVAQAANDPRKSVDAAFYFAPLRAWELVLGALLAMARPDPSRLGAAWREVLAWLGLTLVLVPIFLYDHGTPFPGLAAAPPCVGAALLIFTGGPLSAQNAAAACAPTRAATALSWRPAVFIGLASYSYYLWHWPLLSFASYVVMRELTIWESLLVLVVSFLVSVASLRYVERPFRRADAVASRRTIFTTTAAFLLACVAFGVVLQKTDGLPQRYSAEVLALSTGDSAEFGVELKDCANQRDRLTPEAQKAVFVMFCAAGDQTKTPRTLLWGDSHALSISLAFASATEARGESILVTSRASCPPVVGYDWKPLQTWRGCSVHNRAVFNSLERLGIEHVYLFAAWGAYANEFGDEPSQESAARFEAALTEMLEELRDRGVTVTIGGSVPVYHGFHIPSIMHRAAVLGVTPQIDVSRAAHERDQAPEKGILQRVAAEIGATYFALDDLLCDETDCIYQRDGLPLYADHGHVNLRGAAAMVEAIGALMDGRSPSQGAK
jgi:peptidoglycan/LPS O-acetylase OafA/YrhL